MGDGSDDPRQVVLHGNIRCTLTQIVATVCSVVKHIKFKKHYLLYSMLETDVLLNILVEYF